MDVKARILRAMRARIIFTQHALNEMNAPDEMITTEEVRDVVLHGVVIEDYPGDPRGHSCLLVGRTARRRVIHVVCAPKVDYLVIITAYVPNPKEWDETLTKRGR